MLRRGLPVSCAIGFSSSCSDDVRPRAHTTLRGKRCTRQGCVRPARPALVLRPCESSRPGGGRILFSSMAGETGEAGVRRRSLLTFASERWIKKTNTGRGTSDFAVTYARKSAYVVKSTAPLSSGKKMLPLESAVRAKDISPRRPIIVDAQGKRRRRQRL